MILRCLQLRCDRWPKPSCLIVYCLCPKASATAPDLSQFRDAWFWTHIWEPVLMVGSVLSVPLFLSIFCMFLPTCWSPCHTGSCSSYNSSCSSAYLPVPHLTVVCLWLIVQMTCWFLLMECCGIAARPLRSCQCWDSPLGQCCSSGFFLWVVCR